MARVAQLNFQNCYLTLDMATGDYKNNKWDHPRWNLPVFKPKSECPVLEAVVRELFRLSSDQDEMTRHFWEILGYLMLPDNLRKKRIVFCGEPFGKKLGQFFVDTVGWGLLNFGHERENEQNTIVVPIFPVSDFVSRNSDIFDDEKEIHGFVANMVRSLQNYIRRGHFIEPKDCIDAREKYFAKADTVHGFLAEKCVIVDDDSVTTKCADLFHAYRLWCARKCTKPLRRKVLLDDLTRRGMPIAVVGDAQHIVGLVLHSEMV